MHHRSSIRFIGLLAIVMALAAGPATAGAATPADPHFGDQWALRPGGPLDVAKAWGVADGTGSVVAVIDSGVDTTHPDLRGAMWTNPGEVPGNGIDDDHDGWVDDVNGINVIDHNGNVTDHEGHGTHIAGIIAAQRNNVGVVGIAPGARIMAVRVLDNNNQGNTADVATGIRYATAHGATEINLSLTGDEPDPDLRDAIAQADAAGVEVVSAAGNSGRNLDLRAAYPASYTDVGLIAVGATDSDGILTSFSNFGKHVALAAPGLDILSTLMGGGYGLKSGTSMASPMVAGAVAVLHSARPDLSPGQLRDVLTSTATRAHGLAGLLGAGEVDLVAALKSIVPASGWPSRILEARVRRRAQDRSRSLITWTVNGDSQAIASFRVSGKHGVTITRKPPASRGAWVQVRNGRLRIAALDAAGHTLAAVTIKLT